jgi:AP-2 complex subunit alpha
VPFPRQNYVCANHPTRTSKTFVKKKAALTLLRLYRKNSGIVQPQWTERIISLMDDIDIGVALSVTSLVMALAQDNLEQYKGAYVKAAARLKRILIDGEYTTDYLYYKVPCPWIQIKLLRLLQYFPPSGQCLGPQNAIVLAVDVC